MNTAVEIIKAEDGSVDWAAMQAKVEAAIAADKAQEAEAAELEGIAPMPEDLVPLREEKRMLDDQIDELTARKKEIQEEFGKRLDDAGLIGFELNGKVHARVTRGTRHNIDSKKLKEKMPHVWEQFMKVTAYRSVRVD